MSENAAAPVKLRADVLAVSAYRQGAAPTKPGFKLSSNENPFEPLPGVLDAIAARSDINRYAAAALPELRTLLAEEWGVVADHVHFGAGSVAILFQLVQAAAGLGDEVLYAWPSFEAYPSLGLASGATPVGVPLATDSTPDLEAMAAAVTDRTRVVLLCTPNNPTGPTITRAGFDRFMTQVPSDVLVVLDEAYAEFVADPDAVRGTDVVGAHPNLVILRTFSKAYGLAGLRIGYGIGDPAILAAASTVGIPLSVTGIAEAAAVASLAPDARVAHTERIAALVARRDELAQALRVLGIDVPDAQGNFVWIPQSERVDAAALAAAFAEAGTLVRPFAGVGVRVSVGEAESVAAVVEIVRAYLGS